MKISHQGKEVEAYSLIMKKENALEIISGKKKLEIRSFSDYYVQMFTDKKLVAENDKLKEEGRDDECVAPLKATEYIRFHDYNNSWYLDVHVHEIALYMMCQEDIEELAEEFDFHDYDNEWQKYENTPDEDKPLFYWLHIDKVIGHNLH